MVARFKLSAEICYKTEVATVLYGSLTKFSPFLLSEVGWHPNSSAIFKMAMVDTMASCIAIFHSFILSCGPDVCSMHKGRENILSYRQVFMDILRMLAIPIRLQNF